MAVHGVTVRRVRGSVGVITCGRGIHGTRGTPRNEKKKNVEQHAIHTSAMSTNPLTNTLSALSRCDSADSVGSAAILYDAETAQRLRWRPKRHERRSKRDS